MDDLKFVYKHFRFPRCSIGIRAATHQGRHGLGFHYQRGETFWDPREKGGYTRCFIYDADSNLKSTSVAECSPRDAFCYKIGRDISRGRALKLLA